MAKQSKGTTQRPLSRRERRAQARYEAPARTRGSVRRAARPAWQSPVVLVTVAAVLVGVAIIAFARPPAGGSDTLVEPPTRYEVGLADGDVVGSATAPVVMELYADFQCPACKLFATTQLPSLLNDFVRPGTLRIEARDIDILGTGSPNESLELAVGAACAAEQDRYWQFHDFVFWNQKRENRGDHNAEFIASLAIAAGVDRTAWDACIARDDLRAAVDTATRTAVAAGINSTPTLVINGQKIVGVPQYTQLADAIRQAAAGESPAATVSPS